MNERIKALAEQAALKESGIKFWWSEVMIEKFAESLIRECVEQGKLIQSQTVTNGSEEYVAGREMGIEVFINQIQKHFGVEE